MARLPNITRGPITLSRIDYAANLSQETYAFTAVLAIDGKTSVVSNEGCGGPNHIREHAVNALVEAHAATLPPEAGLRMSADFLVNLMVGDALEKRHLLKILLKMKKKGYTHRVALGEGLELYVVAKDEAEARARVARGKHASKAATATITAL
jgi:hypothetical protein